MRTIVFAAFSITLALQTGCNRTDPELAAMVKKEVDAYLASRPELKAEENGAIRVIEAAKTLEPLPSEIDKDGFDPSSEDGARMLGAYLDKHSKALNHIASALSVPGIQYCLGLDKGAEAVIPPLIQLLHAAKALALRGRALRAAGKNGAALDDHFACLDLGVSLSREPFLVTHMVALRCEAEALDGFIGWLEESPPERLVLDAMINGLAERYKKRGSMKDALDGEYYIFQLFVLARAAAGEMKVRSNFKKDYEVFSKWRSRYASVSEEKYFEISEDLRSGRFEEELAREQGKAASVAAMTLPSVGRAVAACARNAALWRGAMLSAAILRAKAASGAFPANLENATAGIGESWRIDPFSGKDMIFRAAGEGFVLYSVGPDMEDNGGSDSRLTARSDVEKARDIVLFKS